jgi:hypothetical protein
VSWNTTASKDRTVFLQRGRKLRQQVAPKRWYLSAKPHGGLNTHRFWLASIFIDLELLM